MEALVQYNWPGNIRELQNVIERAVVLSPGPVLKLGPDLLPIVQDAASSTSAPSSAPDAAPPVLLPLEEAERRHIEAVLAHTNGVVEGPEGAARILDVHPNTLRSRMKKLGVARVRHDISEREPLPEP